MKNNYDYSKNNCYHLIQYNHLFGEKERRLKLADNFNPFIFAPIYLPVEPLPKIVDFNGIEIESGVEFIENLSLCAHGQLMDTEGR